MFLHNFYFIVCFEIFPGLRDCWATLPFMASITFAYCAVHAYLFDEIKLLPIFVFYFLIIYTDIIQWFTSSFTERLISCCYVGNCSTNCCLPIWFQC